MKARRFWDVTKGLVIGGVITLVALSSLAVSDAAQFGSTEDRIADIEDDITELNLRIDSLERSTRAWGTMYLLSEGIEFGGESKGVTYMWIDAFARVDEPSDCTSDNSPLEETKFVLYVETWNTVILPRYMIPYTLIDTEWLEGDADRNCVWTYFVPSIPVSDEYRLETYITHLRTGGGYGWEWSEDDLDENRGIRLNID